MPWAIASAVAGGVSLVSGLMGSRKASRAANKAARLERVMTGEEVKRLRVDQVRGMSQVSLLQASSGFADTSVSAQAYKTEFGRLQQEEVDWLKLVGSSRYNQQKSRADAFMAEGIGRAAGDVVSIFSALEKRKI